MNSLTNSVDLQSLSNRCKINYGLDLADEFRCRWSLHARDKQKLPPGNWQTWLIKAGRGWGKTRTGAETIRIWKEKYPLIHIVASTAADGRDVCIKGDGGILQCSLKRDMPHYEPSKRCLTWKNGSKAIIFSAEEPDQLRGPQCYKAWADELAKWKYPEAWDQLNMGLRLGDNPQVIVTTTPRPTKIIKELIGSPNTVVTEGTSYENKDNLAPKFFDFILKKYEGTRLGRQEINAEILEDVEGALWHMSLIDRNRVKKAPELKRVLVAIDPAVTSNPDSDETGIIGGGIDYNNEVYILNDLSGILTPKEWAERAIYNLEEVLKGDNIVAEVNNGGDLVKVNLQTIRKSINPIMVHASRGKVTRAEPVVGLYEQGRVHHVGIFPELEDQMINWDAKAGDRSPDRIDALVWLVSALLLEKQYEFYVG